MPSPRNPRPTEKRSIADFFQPYIKSSVPAKRPSPSIEESAQRSSKRDIPTVTTPKANRRPVNDYVGTPSSSSSRLSPLSAPGSRASLSIPIRSPRPKDTIEPPSTYKRAPQFGVDRKRRSPSPESRKSFSFTELPISTQAVVKKGEVVEILDSDDDDDAESFASLESLTDIFGKKQDGDATSLSSSPELDEAKLEAERIKTLSQFTRGRSDALVGKEKLRALYAKERTQKFDISNLIGDHFDDDEIEQKVKKARSDVEASAKTPDSDRHPALDKKLLAAIVAAEDGENGLTRLMDAVDRTEALATDRVFLFFGVHGLNDWHGEPPATFDFPETAIPNHLWPPADDESRSRAFKSGYMAEIAAQGRMPDEALSWTFHSVVLEQDDDMRQAYIDCLKCASSSWTRTNVTAQDVQTVFQTLGADAASLQDSTTIQPRHRLVRPPARRDPKYLLAALDLFQSICHDMDFLALSKLTSMICRLAIDAELMSDSQVSCRVDQTLEVLLSLPDSDVRSHVAERILADVGHHLKDATLQALLLSHILPTSTTAAKIRILLAQSFLFGAHILKDDSSLCPQISLDLLTEHVSTSPTFDTRRRKGSDTLDYDALRALTHVLDVAISDGGRPANFTSRPEELAFNKSVDRLADSIRATYVAIIDTGASHMRRTEAKDVLQALHWRLLYSVRTEVRPKKNIFDPKTGKARDAEEERIEEKGKDFMKQFLARRKEREKAKKISERSSVKQQDMKPVISSDSSEPSETEQLIRRQLELSE
ncbi:uncharacterized protein Z518_01141 [Rhinocladiella mackenziei CBS 650.93]|uniref:Uncharacterized protein n=1 Tax=Rhinocladiella mackenziei CBS 650.93 TaxID=1442369 RepID=A0A0D2JKT6_9EURO|nr:uncharacterized protein Z518_01141 [Rhinocladiella mackenziei CBS 650.93]KIX10060.1 hypothetical protein Z518_01141 [Rhinocladiella mackenziei CBS 650.93]